MESTGDYREKIQFLLKVILVISLSADKPKMLQETVCELCGAEKVMLGSASTAVTAAAAGNVDVACRA